MALDLMASFTQPPPSIDYVLPNMVAGTVGAIVSPGGTGKSMLILQLAIQIAGGPDLLELGNLRHGRVIYLPAEDPRIAIHQHLYALGHYLSAEQKHEVASNLVIEPLIGKCPNIMAFNWFDNLKRAADGHRLMILDTLRRFHIEEENASGPMAQVIGCMEAIAAETGCSIVFLHHTSKGAAMAEFGDQQQASRGSSVLVDNIRWQSYLSSMTETEAGKWGVEVSQRRHFVRFGISKANYGAPFSDECWFRRHDGGVLKRAVLEHQKPKSPIKRKFRMKGDNDDW
ncbi:helicase RepA family protein [Carnimonas bestiolae]|uniref:helicase RepA family protein n=1 Tax=Carnimonas bestiolae TaxID=3402172 RepID=UPI003EDB93FD